MLDYDFFSEWPFSPSRYKTCFSVDYTLLLASTSIFTMAPRGVLAEGHGGCSGLWGVSFPLERGLAAQGNLQCPLIPWSLRVPTAGVHPCLPGVLGPLSCLVPGRLAAGVGAGALGYQRDQFPGLASLAWGLLLLCLAGDLLL
ncbi:hypothetical protein CHARACLAT_022277 [Characodon lateralis]|uniref:Uncharacterized protein n=1 Tax=Characodon lateralis TaxID=208331 RepID=A0ABU7DBB5_9TELE|nr:hypothetical protein [Characodon lateralis]